MSAHTPGPWAARPFPAYGYGITAEDSPQARESFAVVHFADISRGRTAERARGDARLIAAAPELLDALRAAVDLYGKPGGPWNVPGSAGTWIAQARAAIAAATATGETT